MSSTLNTNWGQLRINCLQIFSVRTENPEQFLPTRLAGWRNLSMSGLISHKKLRDTYRGEEFLFSYHIVSDITL